MAPMKVVAYARVSTDEQARSGYSVADQEEALRAWCAENGHELLEVVRDEGHSGAYLERQGLDRVRDLVEAGGVSLVVAQDADRLTREPGHRALLDEEFERFGTRLVALDDWGDDSHEGQLLRFLKGWVSKGERLKIAERTRRGKRQKAKQGLIVAPPTAPYGFRLNEARDAYLVEDAQMATVRRIFQMVADGETRLRELEELPQLVEEYLKELPHLMDRMPVVREYETVPDERTGENPSGLYTLTPERIRHLPEEEEVGAKRLAAEAARFRELYTLLDLRVAVHENGDLDVAVGTTNTKGVMP
jgi:DNA invertase Pin-like site-specific DNA recombinase